MTRKLPANIPSPEDRGAVRPDEPGKVDWAKVDAQIVALGTLREIANELKVPLGEALPTVKNLVERNAEMLAELATLRDEGDAL
jgi:hypothetical protein